MTIPFVVFYEAPRQQGSIHELNRLWDSHPELSSLCDMTVVWMSDQEATHPSSRCPQRLGYGKILGFTKRVKLAIVVHVVFDMQ
jgi:hypothetical protein